MMLKPAVFCQDKEYFKLFDFYLLSQIVVIYRQLYLCSLRMRNHHNNV